MVITTLHNKTKSVLVFVEGQVGDLRKVFDIPSGKSHQVRSNLTATYNEHWFGFAPSMAKSIRFTSDDFINWKEIEIRPKENDPTKFEWKGKIAAKSKPQPPNSSTQSAPASPSDSPSPDHSTFRSSEILLEKDLKVSQRVILEILGRMEALRLNKVKIWSNQCSHLLEKFREGKDIIFARLHVLSNMVEEGPMIERYSPLAKFICCLLEGEALLLLCSKNDKYNKAAFALSSPRSPSVPTFSRFALVLRELDWILDFICSVVHMYVHGNSSYEDWGWCEDRCRLVGMFANEFGAAHGVSLKADGSRQALDQEDFQKSLKSKNNWFRRRNEFRDTLDVIWRKRLQSPSHTPEADSVPDCFWIDNLDFKYVRHLAHGGYKLVDKSKWLGEMVAVAIVTNISYQQLVAEAGILARVQHPNVVELMGCAYKEDDLNKSTGYLVTELMDEDLESLICRQQQLRRLESGRTMEGSPFALPVAVDIALQIVEAMIYLKECGVLHRDLKPKNCLVSAKYWKHSFPGCSEAPIYYTVKLIDFGAAKMRGEDSYFHSYKKGTPYYMAPEVYGEEVPYTWSADVYSFGMTCYQIFTGRAPFQDMTKFVEVQKFIRGGKRPSFPAECPGVLKGLIEKCWDQNPAARPSFQDIRKYLWRLKLHAWSSDAVMRSRRRDSLSVVVFGGLK